MGERGAAVSGSGHRAVERAALVLGLLVLWLGGYFAVAWHVDPGRATSLRLPLDDRIPFWPASVYLYAWVYTALLFPLFAVRCDALFRRVAAAYAAVVVASLACFALFPVSAAGFRPEADAFAPDSFARWGLHLLYTLDPLVNLFPSLHLAIATLAALAAWTARPAYGALAGLGWACIAVSILTVKQHYVLDAAGGVALGAAAWALCVRSYTPPDPGAAAYSWRGPLAYLAFHASVYLGLYAAYRGGWGPA